MAISKTITQLPGVTLPLSGSEEIPVWQEGKTGKATIAEITAAVSGDLDLHRSDLDNPHQTALSQLIDVNFDPFIDGDLIQFNENLNVWKNIRKENVTDGGNF